MPTACAPAASARHGGSEKFGVPSFALALWCVDVDGVDFGGDEGGERWVGGDDVGFGGGDVHT